MERKKQRSPVTNNYYAERDFTVGKTVQLAGFKFMLVSCDEYTEKYMEDNGDQFPEATYKALMKKIKAPAVNFPSLTEYAMHLLSKLDTNNDKFIDFAEFTVGLKNMGINVAEHEAAALMRRFDTNGDGRISLQEFYNALDQN